MRSETKTPLSTTSTLAASQITFLILVCMCVSSLLTKVTKVVVHGAPSCLFLGYLCRIANVSTVSTCFVLF